MAEFRAPGSGGAVFPFSPRRGRGLAVGGAAVVASILVLAAASFACSPAVGSSSLTPDAGASGSRVLVEGWGYTAPVEIRWGSATGPLLAQATPDGNRISQRVTIPASEPGFYSVVVVGYDSVTNQSFRSSSTFHVTGAAAAATDPVPAEPALPDPAPAASTAAPGASATAPAPVVPASGSAPATASPVESPLSTPAQVATAMPGSTPAASAPATAAARLTAAPSVASRVPGAAVPVAAVSQAAVPAESAAPSTAPGPVATAPVGAPAAVEALPQPWSAAPAESHGLFEATSRHGRPLGAGIVFLALGFAAAFAFAAVLGKRRLARATTLSGS